MRVSSMVLLALCFWHHVAQCPLGVCRRIPSSAREGAVFRLARTAKQAISVYIVDAGGRGPVSKQAARSQIGFSDTRLGRILVGEASGAVRCRPLHGGFVSPADDKILYTGRWDLSSPSTPWCAWQGSSIMANFHGRAISATFKSSHSTEYLFVIIDNDLDNARTVAVTPGQNTIVLGAGLADTAHKVEIVKKTYSHMSNKLTFYGFEVAGAGLLAPPRRPPVKLEFYGDSNLSGHSCEHEGNQEAQIYRDSYYGYAGITSRMLNAEYHNVSKGGATISSQHGVYDRIGYDCADPKWRFGSFTPDAVIVNLGANDVGSGKPAMKSDYHDFLDDLRATHPRAHIMLFNAWGWSYDEPAEFLHEVIAERGDPNMSSKTFPWLFDEWHGCQYDHAGMANVLAGHLVDQLDLPLPNPSDVMNGFGQHGNVANGSFEDVAPFGGYGWRYFLDPNVERLSGEAHDGQHFVRLADGADVHQANPASNGVAYTVTVWMRGRTEQGRGQIHIEFRDQKMWTPPLATHTETTELTTQWQAFTATVTAPTGTAHPTAQIVVFLKAGPGSLVDVDDVRLSHNSEPFASPSAPAAQD